MVTFNVISKAALPCYRSASSPRRCHPEVFPQTPTAEEEKENEGFPELLKPQRSDGKEKELCRNKSRRPAEKTHLERQEGEGMFYQEPH